MPSTSPSLAQSPPLQASRPIRPIRIATRESRLALWQAEHVAEKLRALYPERTTTLIPMTTRGDKVLDRSLSKVGGKGLFIKELEMALLEDEADLAVHSLKDVPMELEAAFTIAAYLPREVPDDAFVSTRFAHINDLPKGSVIGTSSLRRSAVLSAHYPHLVVHLLRGNLDTRLKKLDNGDYDAIILAAAGLMRLGYQERIRHMLSKHEFLPAPGQGVVAIEVLAERQDIIADIKPLQCIQTAMTSLAERGFARVLQGGCEVPLAAFATLSHHTLTLKGWVADPAGHQFLKADSKIELPLKHQEKPNADTLYRAGRCGEDLARTLIQQGAAALVAQARAQSQGHSPSRPPTQSRASD